MTSTGSEIQVSLMQMMSGDSKDSSGIIKPHLRKTERALKWTSRTLLIAEGGLVRNPLLENSQTH